MQNYLKMIISRLPNRYQQELKRIHFSRQIKKQRFVTNEKEYYLLNDFCEEGDWVLDIGANVGHYTAKLSEIVCNSGRVIAFEPVPETFELLAANSTRFKHRNVTLINSAVSENINVMGMEIPKFDSGLNNYYQACLTNQKTNLNVFCINIDSLSLPHSITLVKIDTEGHEFSALKGMTELLLRDHPILIVEDNSPQIITFLDKFGYLSKKLENSNNRVFQIS